MDKGQFAKIAAAIDGYDPRWKIFQNPQIMEQWFMELRDLPYDLTQAAVRRLARSDTKITVGSIRKTAKEILWDNLDPKDKEFYDKLLFLDRFDRKEKELGKELFLDDRSNVYLGLDATEP